MTKHDPMGDRLKAYESAETHRYCEVGLPICVRLDGKAFHTFTNGLTRPYDRRLSDLMIETTKYLVENTHAVIGYTQSDEITLIYNYEGNAQPLYGGRVHKLTSLLAGMCSSKFTNLLPSYLPEKKEAIPSFDARVFTVPNHVEATNVLLWRWFDARKNSVAMLAQSIFSHKELQGKDGLTMKQMCEERGYNWDNYPDFFKWGTFVQRKTVERELTHEELEKIPEKHRPEGKVSRSKVEILALPPFNRVSNRHGVVFHGQEPWLSTTSAEEDDPNVML